MLDRMKSWIQFKFVKKIAIEVDEEGYLEPPSELFGTINLVDQIQRVSGLDYKLGEERGFYNNCYYVMVTNKVGDIIELYFSLDNNYADMDLSEFISRTLSNPTTASERPG